MQVLPFPQQLIIRVPISSAFVSLRLKKTSASFGQTYVPGQRLITELFKSLNSLLMRSISSFDKSCLCVCYCRRTFHAAASRAVAITAIVADRKTIVAAVRIRFHGYKEAQRTKTKTRSNAREEYYYSMSCCLMT
mmetsp:Transcript_943/g.1417  ORF Transcript_943/g.1417 Transcript_943/m.1417 type:complete len:135 (-) Transcript_943:28-432(-)